MDGVVAATPTIAERFPEENTVVVRNYPRLDREWTDVAGKIRYSDRNPILTYVGNITEVRGIFQMLRAVEIMTKNRTVSFDLVGRFGSEDVRQAAIQMDGWDHVNEVGWVGRREVREVLSRSRVGLALLHPVPGYLDSLPIKLFEYMLAGVPVVVSDFSLWRSIVEDCNCGIVVDPLKPEKIAEAVGWLLDDPVEAKEMGSRGREMVLSEYNWEAEKSNLVRGYERFIGS